MLSICKFDAGQQIKRIKARKERSFRERKKKKRGGWRDAKLANFQ